MGLTGSLAFIQLLMRRPGLRNEKLISSNKVHLIGLGRDLMVKLLSSMLKTLEPAPNTNKERKEKSKSN